MSHSSTSQEQEPTRLVSASEAARRGGMSTAALLRFCRKHSEKPDALLVSAGGLKPPGWAFVEAHAEMIVNRIKQEKNP